eukprot:TRINITY_DN1644_c0_g1_i1.p1 TRINITY_DN1644_c0_g1~~TRINITY_DN1644_c0_g1_i1.p1  ORF type:complete len:198 (+),score=31.71 TRINITY_DN1644_c0_g1_i1:418-1011(+)
MKKNIEANRGLLGSCICEVLSLNWGDLSPALLSLAEPGKKRSWKEKSKAGKANKKLKWNGQEDGSVGEEMTVRRASSEKWNEVMVPEKDSTSDEEDSGDSSKGALDLILGSDCFYDSADFEDILMTVSFLMRSHPDCKFITTYQNRCASRSIEHLLEKWGLIAEQTPISQFLDQFDTLAYQNILLFTIQAKTIPFDN